MEIVWNIPGGLQAIDRLEELCQYLENFPESKLVSAIREEIARLEELGV